MRKHTARPARPHTDEMTAAMMPFMQMQAPMTHLWSELGERMVDFAQERGSKFMHANRDILRAKDPAGLLDAQSRYVRELVEDYSGEAAAIAETCTKCFMHAYDGKSR